MKGSAARSTAEETLTLNVNRLHRDGCLDPGSSGSRSGSAEDNLFAPISRGMSDSLLTLSYGLPGASAKDLDEIVPIIRVPCRYGGSRPYFVCPGIVNGVYCGRRVVCLYLADRYFVCRHCNGTVDRPAAIQRQAERRTHDYKRNGTTSLFAALDVTRARCASQKSPDSASTQAALARP